MRRAPPPDDSRGRRSERIPRPRPLAPTSRSYLLDLSLLAGEGLIDLLDEAVGQLLHLGGALVVIVLTHVPILIELLEQLHPLAANIAHGHAGMLCVLVC